MLAVFESDGIESCNRVKLTVSGKESNGCASGSGTTSTTNTVDVVLRVIGVVVVEHMGDVANIFSSKHRLAVEYGGYCIATFQRGKYVRLDSEVLSAICESFTP